MGLMVDLGFTVWAIGMISVRVLMIIMLLNALFLRFLDFFEVIPFLAIKYMTYVTLFAVVIAGFFGDFFSIVVGCFALYFFFGLLEKHASEWGVGRVRHPGGLVRKPRSDPDDVGGDSEG